MGGGGSSAYNDRPPSTNRGNSYSDFLPGYDATHSTRGLDDAAHHGYDSELRALVGNHYDVRGPNLGYDDDLKYVDARYLDGPGRRWYPTRSRVGSVTTQSGYADRSSGGGCGGWNEPPRQLDGNRGGPPQTGLGMSDRFDRGGRLRSTPDMDRSLSTQAGHSWWDNAGQSEGYAQSRGAQGGFSTYTDLQLYDHRSRGGGGGGRRQHTPGYRDPFANSNDPNAY